MTRRSRGTGRYFTGEKDITITSSTYAGGGPLVVMLHGYGTGASDFSNPSTRTDLDLLAATGCVVVIADAGGTNTWGLDTVVHPTSGRIAAIRTWAASAWGADPDRMALIGDSMGAMNALGYTWRSPSTVKAVACRLPVVAADALHDRDPAGLGAAIDAAYGSQANWEADKANRDPSATGNAAAIAAVRDRVRIWYSGNDSVVLPADIAAYVSATGVRAVPLGDIGHDAAAFATAMDDYGQARWIWSRLNT